MGFGGRGSALEMLNKLWHKAFQSGKEANPAYTSRVRGLGATDAAAAIANCDPGRHDRPCHLPVASCDNATAVPPSCVSAFLTGPTTDGVACAAIDMSRSAREDMAMVAGCWLLVAGCWLLLLLLRLLVLLLPLTTGGGLLF